jgi:hypothetical protein
MEVSIEYLVGFGVGLFVVFAAMVIIGLYIGKKRGPCKYDERQAIARGKAYQAAFWTLVAFLCINGMFCSATGVLWADTMTGSFIGICLAILVYAVICIAKDAYFALREKPKFYFVLFGFLMIFNLAVVLLNYSEGTPFITDGMLNFHCMNLVIVVMFAVLLITLTAKHIAEKKRRETE